MYIEFRVKGLGFMYTDVCTYVKHIYSDVY